MIKESETVLELIDVGKFYEDNKWVLKNINFRINKGEFVAILGKNGCGKTTLLKLISEIQKPSKGTINLKSNVAAIIDFGSNIFPELNGYQNIDLFGKIYGYNKDKIIKLKEHVEAFSELGEMLNLQLKNYSNGMYLRFAFSLNIFFESELFLFDEIISVGDTSFQKKCFDALEKLVEKGVTIIYVTHNFQEIEKYCSRCILIQEGIVVADDKPQKVYKQYLNISDVENKLAFKPFNIKKNINYNINDKTLEINNLYLVNNSKASNVFRFSDSIKVIIEWEKIKANTGISFELFISDLYENALIHFSNTIGENKTDVKNLVFSPCGNYKEVFVLPKFLFNKGLFSLNLVINTFNSSLEYKVIGKMIEKYYFEIIGDDDEEMVNFWPYNHSVFRIKVNKKSIKL